MTWTIEDLETLLHTPAELDPELVEWIDPHGPLGPAMRHPLVYETLAVPQLNNMMNERLKAKKAAVREALGRRQWNSYVYLHERPWRIDAFRKIAWRMGDQSYWKLLGSIYVDTENLWQNYDAWVDLLRAERRYRSYLMSTEERQALKRMDPVIEVYRGWSETGVGEHGLSWTTSLDTAKFFARRLADPEERKFISTGTVDRWRVLAYFTGRSESEIVALPGDVKDITTTAL